MFILVEEGITTAGMAARFILKATMVMAIIAIIVKVESARASTTVVNMRVWSMALEPVVNMAAVNTAAVNTAAVNTAAVNMAARVVENTVVVKVAENIGNRMARQSIPVLAVLAGEPAKMDRMIFAGGVV